MSKLKTYQKSEIFRRVKRGERPKSIALEYGITRERVWTIMATNPGHSGTVDFESLYRKLAGPR